MTILIAVALLVGLLVPATALAKTATRLTATLNTQWEHYDLVPVLTGTLKTSKGAALKYQSVALYRDGVKVASKKTNSSGRVAFSVRIPTDNLEGVWTLRYAGTKAYAQSTSAARRTRIHVHFSGESQIPTALDTNQDGTIDMYAVLIDMRLLGDSTYEIWSSVKSYRYVQFMDGNDTTDFYTGQEAVNNGSFTVSMEAGYSITIECPNADPVHVFIW